MVIKTYNLNKMDYFIEPLAIIASGMFKLNVFATFIELNVMCWLGQAVDRTAIKCCSMVDKTT